MIIPHDKFCVLPWISLEASPLGTVRPCCLAKDEIVDDLGHKIRVDQTPLVEIQNSSYMQQLRNQFLSGQQPNTCQRCWDEEKSGRVSKRMNTLDRLKHIVGDQPWTTDAKPLMFLDLKLGNICNLKCRICGSWSSSTFAAEDIRSLPRHQRKTSWYYEALHQGAWPRTSDKFWAEMKAVSTDIRYLEFTGGEPFMIEQHFDLLRMLIQLGVAQQVEIHYNTNGTQYPEFAEEIWQHFKTVEIAFSIDDVSQRFEYQRSGADWHTVNHNISRFKSLRDRNTNVTLQVCSTVSAFNVFNLESLASWIDQQGFDFVYWNVLHDPYYLSVCALPQHIKCAAEQYLMACQASSKHKQEFENIIGFMRQGESLDGSQLRQRILELDARRGETVSSVIPELSSRLMT
jgi:organic radical activating enzyme